MGTYSKVFSTAIACVLAMAVALSASDVAKHRVLIGEDKVDGSPNESNNKVASSPPTISSPVVIDEIHKGHSLPPQSKQSPPNIHPDPVITISPPLVDNSQKLAPPIGPENAKPAAVNNVEDKASQSPPNKEGNKDPRDPKEEDNKPVLEKGDHKALQAPPLASTTPDAPKADNVQKQNEGTLKSGNSGEDNNKNVSCDTANASGLTCRIGGLVACLLQSETKSRELFLVIQNTGEDDLNVNISSPDKIKIDSYSLNLPKQSKRKVNLTADTSMDLKIILDTGKGDCVLQTKASTSDWFYLQQFPAYAAQVRPMHGAYFLLATVIIVGGTWAFCKFGKKEKRTDAGIPYQQLEMATNARSASVPSHANVADTWDQSWDDDWDDEESVRTSAKQTAENVSSNGLSSRPANPNQNGWEIDWDD